MKMGTTLSPWRYDSTLDRTLQLANLRRPAISHFAILGDLPSVAAFMLMRSLVRLNQRPN
jgi:hypothetical protein